VTASRVTAGARWREAVRPERADRTAMRDLRAASFHSASWGMVEVRTWPTREAMARAIRREERNAPYSDWRPVVRLELTEGY